MNTTIVDRRKIVGYLGCVTLFLGLFSPIAIGPFGQNASLIDAPLLFLLEAGFVGVGIIWLLKESFRSLFVWGIIASVTNLLVLVAVIVAKSGGKGNMKYEIRHLVVGLGPFVDRIHDDDCGVTAQGRLSGLQFDHGPRKGDGVVPYIFLRCLWSWHQI
ncbi:MAG: hypothetical protein ACYC0L_04800 [Thermoleophilia bacterium]